MRMEATDGPAAVPVLQYWHTPERPQEIEALTATFRDRNPDLPYRLFCEREARELIAARFGPREVAAFDACAVPAMQADYFRYCAVYALGGVYCDADFRCLRPLRKLVAASPGGRLFRRDPPGYLLNGFFLFPHPGHPLLRLALDVATANIEGRVGEKVQMVTGPWIFSALVTLGELGDDPDLRREADRGGLAALTEPFRRVAATRVPTDSGRLEIDRMTGPLFETIGDYGRVAGALRGLAVSPVEVAEEWIGEPTGEELPYRDGDTHWINWQNRGATIFR